MNVSKLVIAVFASTLALSSFALDKIEKRHTHLSGGNLHKHKVGHRGSARQGEATITTKNGGSVTLESSGITGRTGIKGARGSR